MATTITKTNMAFDQSERAFLQRAPRSLWSDARRRLLRNKAAVGSLIYISILAIIAIAAPLLAPHNPVEIIPGNTYRQAAWIHTNVPTTTGTWQYPLGTDPLGRHLLIPPPYPTPTS